MSFVFTSLVIWKDCILSPPEKGDFLDGVIRECLFEEVVFEKRPSCMGGLIHKKSGERILLLQMYKVVI